MMQHETDTTVTFGNWMLTLFLTFIPIVNIIMLLVWAFSSATPESKANWAKAALTWMVIAFALGILSALLGGFGAALA